MELLLTEAEINRMFIVTILVIVVSMFIVMVNKMGILTSFFKKKVSIDSYPNIFTKARAVDFAPDAIVTINIDGEIIAWNRGAEILFGFREVEMLNKSYLTVIPEQNRLLCTDNFKRIKEGDSTDLGKMVEIKILNKNGKEILVDMLMWMWMDENKSFYSVIINTNRIEQQELAQRNIKIYQIGEEIDKSGIWHWDVVSDIVYYSEGFYNIFEVQTPTANSGTLLKSIYYQDRLMVEDTIRKAFADKQPYEINYRILSRDGHIKFLNCKAKPDLDEDGALRFLSGVIHELKIEKII